MENKKKNLLKIIFSSKLFLIGCFVLAAMVFFAYSKSFYQNYKVQKEIQSLKDEIGSLENKKLESMEILSFVMSDDFVEEKARTELNLKKEDENVIFFKGDDHLQENKTTETNNEPETQKTLNNPIKWWYFFTNKSIQ